MIQKLLCLITFIFFLFLMIIVACACLSLGMFQKQTIGTVNITGIVNSFITTQAKNNISHADLKQSVKDFGSALEKTMIHLSNKKHIVLLPAEAVITGAKDYTQEIQNLLPMPKQQVQAISSRAAPIKPVETSAPNLIKQCLPHEANQIIPSSCNSAEANQNEFL